MITHENVLNIIGDINSIFDVEVDKEVTSIRYQLSEIGLRSKMEDGALDLDLFDAILSYVGANTSVILEIDFNHEFIASDAVIESQSTEYHISVLPPEFDGSETEEDKEKAWDSYGKRLCHFAEAWINQSNTHQQVYPISGYLGYMVSEVFGHKPKSITNDPYISKRFVETIPLDVMDEIKEKLKQTIYEQFGGKSEFEKYANSLAMTSVQYYKDSIENHKKVLEEEASNNEHESEKTKD